MGDAWFCTCGRILHKCGRATHESAHRRRQDGHRFLSEDAYHEMFPNGWAPPPRQPRITAGLIFLETFARHHDSDECLIWPFGRAGSGYGTVIIDGERTAPHRWVCEQTYGPPPSPGHQAAHSCRNGANACITKRHLRWATPLENAADRVRDGTNRNGEQRYNAKLTAAAVKEIRRVGGTVKQKVLAERFGVSTSVIYNVLKGRTWKLEGATP